MSSSVFFKFKSQREPARVVFDGTGISVFELKKEIIRLNRLGDGLDFDLSIYSEDNEEYDDDTTIIPRGTSIIARRLPASRPGQGKAARYVSGKAPVNARSAPRSEPTSKSVAPGSSTATAQSTPDMNASEEDRINAMFKQQTNSWEQQQAEMAHATPVYRGNYKGKPANVPDHPPPTGYVCYRCGEKGHWIQACPTNGDPNMENRPRIKRTTGIPRSFLKTVEKPVLNGDGADNTKPSKGVMVNAAGEWVIAEPDKASWEQFQAKTKASAAAQAAAESGNKELRDRGLECSIDKRMFVEPVKTPCCSKTYCNDCITNALIESDLVCPNCSTEGVLIDNLVHDDEMIANIKVYQDEKAEAKQKEKSKTPEPKKEETPAQDSKDNEKYSKSPSSKSTTTSSPKSPGSGTSKKRQAEDEAVKVEAPAMKKQRSQESQPAAATANGFNPAIFNPMTGFPGNMPFNPPMFGNFLSQQGMNGMNFSSMGMPPMPSMMGMNPAMMNPMMAPNMMGGNNWGGMGGMNFPPQQNGMFNSGMMPNIPVALGMNGHANGNMPQVQSHGGNFPNQQRTVFSDPFPKREEDNAYFRQPVNPHRHQNRQKRLGGEAGPGSKQSTRAATLSIPPLPHSPVSTTLQRGLAGLSGIPEVRSGIPSPPASPPLAAYATKQELFNPNKSPEARRGGATYTITDECERLFCEKLRAVFLGERIQTNQDSLVMDTKYNKGYRKHDLAVRSAPFITEFIEVWDYIGGARFRGFTADGPRGRALFVFLDQGAIGSDLKSGLMALIELASSSHFDCTSLVACLDRKSEGNELKDLIRNFKWIGFELATLDRWTKVKNVTSSKWLFMEMEV